MCEIESPCICEILSYLKCYHIVAFLLQEWCLLCSLSEAVFSTVCQFFVRSSQFGRALKKIPGTYYGRNQTSGLLATTQRLMLDSNYKTSEKFRPLVGQPCDDDS